MKKTLVALLVVGALFVFSGHVFAAEAKKAAAKETKEAADTDQAVKEIMKREALQNAKDELNSHEWTIYLTLTPDPSGKKVKATVETDTLTFSGEGRVVSKNLLAGGYPESNYTLTLQDDGTVVWETMQVNEEMGLAFFRGELKDSVMKGVLSLQPKKGAKKTSYFSTIMPEIKPETEPTQPEETGKKKSKKR